MTAKITLYTTYDIPELRMVRRFNGFYANDAPQRAVKVAVSASWWSDEHSLRDGKQVEVSVKGWCKRVKKDGTDSAHAPVDVYAAAHWLTPKDWKTITLRLMVDLAALTPPQ